VEFATFAASGLDILVETLLPRQRVDHVIDIITYQDQLARLQSVLDQLRAGPAVGAAPVAISPATPGENRRCGVGLRAPAVHKPLRRNWLSGGAYRRMTLDG